MPPDHRPAAARPTPVRPAAAAPARVRPAVARPAPVRLAAARCAVLASAVVAASSVVACGSTPSPGPTARTAPAPAGTSAGPPTGGSQGVPGSASAVPSGAQDRVDRALARLERTFRGRIGAYALDLGSGLEVQHRGDERFPLHSTFKAFAAAAIVHRARTTEPGLLERRVRWTSKDVLPNSPVTDRHLADGMTVAELCAATVTTSDNTAGNLLLRRLGGPRGLTRYFRSIGDRVSRMDRYEPRASFWSPGETHDTTTPRAVATDLRRVALDGPVPAADRRRMLGWLRSSTTGTTRIRAGLPRGWTVADKTGTGFTHGAANDVAIVRPGAGRPPLLIAVYTYRDDPDADGDDTVLARTATILVRALGTRR